MQFVQAEVEIKGNGLLVRFAIDLNAALPAGFADRLHSQMTTLDLNARYQRELNNYISGHAISLHGSAASGGSAAVKTFLQLQARSESVRFYRNHWRPCSFARLQHMHPLSMEASQPCYGYLKTFGMTCLLLRP